LDTTKKRTHGSREIFEDQGFLDKCIRRFAEEAGKDEEELRSGKFDIEIIDIE
jgi:hypothetical protein